MVLISQGIRELYPGPYCCYHVISDLNGFILASQYIQEIIKEEGPFNRVIGFS
jgi:hypothetical protein